MWQETQDIGGCLICMSAIFSHFWQVHREFHLMFMGDKWLGLICADTGRSGKWNYSFYYGSEILDMAQTNKNWIPHYKIIFSRK